MDFNNLNNKLSGIYAVADLISERLKPYAEMMKIIEQNVKNALESFAEKAKPLGAFYILAKHQFTYWKPLYLDDVEKIISTSDVNKYLEEKIDDASFIDYSALCNEMIHSELLSDVNKSILNQSFQSMNMGLYDLSLVGIVTVFDGVLSIATNDATTSIIKRLKEIGNRMDALSDDEWEKLNESEMTVFGMYITWTESMKDFQKVSDFKQPESEPKELNRHWISHGRKTSCATKLDCCKMINALYGLIYFGTSV